MQNLELAFLSYFIGFLFLLYIRSYDKYDKEPLGRLVLFSFLGGIISTTVTSFLYFFVNPHFTLFDAIFKVGAVEEFSKLVALFWLYKLIKSEFDEIVDGIIYVAAISLGFSVIENIFYAIRATHPHTLLLQRFFFATVGHISFSVYMGIAFYIHKKIKPNYGGLFLAFLLAMLAHGLYDGMLFEPQFNIFFIPVYLLLIYFQFRLLKVAYAYSQMKQKFSVNNMQLIRKDKHMHCCNCGENTVDEYRFNDMKIYICQNCHNSIIQKSYFDKILKYFRPKLNRKKFFGTFNYSDEIIVLNSKESILYKASKQKLNADVQDLNKWLVNENQKDLRAYAKTIEGKIFHLLGFDMLKI